jgi:MFS family permease
MANIPTFHRIDLAKVGLLSLGHLVVDLYPPFLAALLPLLIDRLGLSLTLASLLASILMFSAYLNQPLFGILSARIGGKSSCSGGPSRSLFSSFFSREKNFSRTQKNP